MTTPEPGSVYNNLMKGKNSTKQPKARTKAQKLKKLKNKSARVSRRRNRK